MSCFVFSECEMDLLYIGKCLVDVFSFLTMTFTQNDACGKIKFKAYIHGV